MILSRIKELRKNNKLTQSQIAEKLNIPQTLQEIGIAEEMIPTLAKQAINDACTPGNPRKVTVEDIIKIYQEAYK